MGTISTSRRAIHRVRVRDVPLDDWYRHFRSRYFPWAESAGTKRGRLDHAHLNLLISFLLTEDSNAVDIGSNDGEELGHIARVAPRGRHFAFEPLPDFALDLRKRFPNVDVHATALSNYSGEATFNYVQNVPAHSGFNVPETALEVTQIKVPVARLDDILPEDYAPAFVKIDVEGVEAEVLEGAERTLSKRPVVAIEHDTGPSSERVFTTLASAGLRVFDMLGDGPYTLEQFRTAEAFNWIAHA
jgi:FkbM family methyltransferase